MISYTKAHTPVLNPYRSPSAFAFGAVTDSVRPENQTRQGAHGGSRWSAQGVGLTSESFSCTQHMIVSRSEAVERNVHVPVWDEQSVAGNAQSPSRASQSWQSFVCLSGCHDAGLERKKLTPWTCNRSRNVAEGRSSPQASQGLVLTRERSHPARSLEQGMIHLQLQAAAANHPVPLLVLAADTSRL